jgi:DNA repair exonuclease SbcCD ATPase subunit
MSEGTVGSQARDVSGKLLVALAVTLVLAIAALVWCYGLSNHLSVAEQKLAAAEQKNTQLAEQQQALSDRLRATTETLGQSVGLTQKQVEARTQALMNAQAAQLMAVRAQSEKTAKLAAEEQAAEAKLGAVQTDVSSVKTDVGGAKASIAATQSDLADTKAQLQRTIGDAGVMSGLIAKTHDELEILKHKGDRNYYEFTLQKGAKPTLLSTIKLQAKKVDDKHSRYTLMVSADDRNIEKKDKSLDEPVQFYTGKDPVLYEIVVNNISKNQISGYLSTPKGAVQPMAAPSN